MKFRITILTIFLTVSAFSQPWMNNEENRNFQQMSFQDYQTAFENYWAEKDVQNGYYTENGVQKKAYGWKQFKRWENFWENRVDQETGAFPSNFQYKVAFTQFKQSQNQNRSATGQWSELGPSTSGGGYAGVGRVNCVAFHPTDANTFWAGTPAGGLWGTTNGGANWTVYTDQNDVLGVSAIAIPSDFATSQTIYIGTGDRDARDNNSMGVLKSTDGGSTWNTTGLSFGLADHNQLTRLLMHPTDNNIIFASAYTGIYRTTDAGANWSQISTSGYIIDMEFKADDPNILFASTLYDGKIYRINVSGGNQTTVYDESSSMRVELAVTANNPNIVYAAVGNSENGLHEITKSTDGGLTFSTAYNGPNILGWDASGGDSGGQAWYDLALEAYPDDSDILYCGGVNTWRSDDGGSTWSIVSHWWGDGVDAVHADKHFLAFNGDVLFECNDGGLYSSDDGFSWTNLSNGIVNSQMYKLSVSQTESNSTITGLQDNGTKLLYTDDSWYDVKGGDGMECLIDYSDYSIQYGTYVRGQISRTMDTWNSSTAIEPSAAGDGAWVTPYIIHPSTPATLYAGYGDVWKTTDRGDSWSQISTMDFGNKIRAMAISVSNPQTLYITDNNSVWKTINDGSTWTDVTSNLPSSAYTSIAIKNDDPNTAWITLGSYNSNVVYQTTNGGTSWTNISTGIPSIPASTIVQNIQNTTETELYVGTDFGVYIKRGTANWQFFNTGMPKVVVSELDIYYDANPDNSKLRAATYGRGLWESDLYTAEAIAPVANFSGSPTTIMEGASVSFTDLSTNNPTSWSWEFEGGTPPTSLGENPNVVYNIAGTYQVKLTVSNTGGSDEEIKLDYIQVNPSGNEPIVDFLANNVSPCTSEIVTFSDGSTESPTSWVWEITPATGFTYVNSTNANSQNPEIDFTEAGDYTIKLTATNAFGFGELTKADYISVTTIPSQPSAISGDTEICENSNEQYSVINTAGLTYNWTLPPSWIGASSNNTIAVTVNNISSSTSGTISVTAENACGISTSSSIDVNVTEIPEAPVFDQSPSEICVGVPAFFSVIETPGTSYQWGHPLGWSLNFVANGVEVTPGSDSGYIMAEGVNACGLGESTSVFVTVKTAPEVPSFVNPATEVCGGTETVYTVANEAGNTYHWTLPSGWSGTSSTNTITVTNDGTAGDISVYAENECGTGDTETISIVITNSGASQPSIISGPNPVCENSTAEYSVVDVPGITYYWSLPSGWSGSGNASTINVNVGSNGGTITLVPFNNCGMGISRTLNVAVNQSVGVPSSLVGNTEVCENSTQTYSISAVNATSYNWQLPQSWLGSSSYNSITTTVGAENGTIEVTPSNACGEGSTVSVPVQVNLLPVANFSYVKNQSEVSFTNLSENGETYLWSFGDTESSTELNPIHNYASSGNYTVTLMAENQCAQKYYYSDINITTIDISAKEVELVKIYPNPTRGLVKIEGLSSQVAEVKVIDLTGRILIQKQMNSESTSNMLDLSKYSQGAYQISIKQGESSFKQMIILQKE